jgi:EAL domain-containing protein (putative c-di-GMP-specific phosphodiesterase class I)
VTITAEGIERSAQLEWLRKRGCHEVQGFLLSRPLAASDLAERYLAVREAAPHPAGSPEPPRLRSGRNT